jgi:hypothetical protein
LAVAKLWKTEAVTTFDTGAPEGHAGLWCFEIVGNNPKGWKEYGREVHVTVELSTGRMQFSQHGIKGVPDRSRGTKPAARNLRPG